MKNKNTILTILGLALGIIGGILFPKVMKEISFLGTIYVNLLKFMIMPIIITSIIVTIYKSKKISNKLILKTIILFIIMFVITFLLTSLVVHISKFGKDFNFEAIEWKEQISDIKYSDVLVNLFPSNIITMIQNNSIFAAIIFSVVFGIAASKTQKGEKVIDFIELIRDIFYKIMEYIMKLTPVGAFSLIGSSIASYGNTIIGVGIKYIGIAYLCSLITIILVMILPVWIIAKINPITYIKKVFKVWIMTITTCSSVATLGTTIKTCNDDFGISRKITDIVVPLGCTIHMCGGAVSFALLGIFCSNLFGINITALLFIQMLISATLINMAAPGIPNGGIVIGATYLSLLGIPLEFIGFYSGIYKFLDMVYTTLNVTGDISANILIDKFNKVN